jgi:peptidyl-dipeptidase A
MKATVSAALALAFSLAACTTAAADRNMGRRRHAAPAPAAGEGGPPDRRSRRLRRPRRKGAGRILRPQRPRAVGERHLHHRRHRRARRPFRHDRHRDAVRLANEAARFAKVPGAELRHQAQARHPARRPRPSGADHAGRGGRAQHDRDRASSPPTARAGHAERQADHRQRHRGEMGTNRNPAELQEMWTSWHTMSARRCAPIISGWSRSPTRAPRSSATDVGAMWRSGYDMPPDEFAALTDKLWAR